MKYSILVPVYNVEKYLSECLDSILCQSLKEYEIILVDDGSTDSSGRICDEYKNKFPNFIKVIHKDNQGLISARRVGIHCATGEYCLFVDSDDTVSFNLIQVIDKYLSSNPEIDILIFSLRYFINGEYVERKRALAQTNKIWENDNKKELYELLATSDILDSLCTKVIRTKLLQNDTFNYEEYYDKNMSEDLLQSIFPITYARKIFFVNEVLYNYRMNECSISHEFSAESISKKSTLHIYDIILNFLSIWNIDTETIRQKIDAKWLNETMYLFSEYYEKAKTKKERKDIINADWNQLLPYEVKNTSSKYENKNYRELYQWICEKRIFNINKYFLKKRIYKKFKRLKRKIK